MPADKTFTEAVVACLLHDAPNDLIARRAAIKEQVQRVLGESSTALPKQPDRAELQQMLDAIRAVLPAEHDRIALVYGGATKIKGYVFEAPKLPEIRGASALLDWVNQRALRDLWHAQLGPLIGEQQAEDCVIVAGGGTFLAFAPIHLGPELAAAVEKCYTEHTLTATSVAVAQSFALIELAYGRNPSGYWLDEFTADWKNDELRPLLASYYYPSDARSTDDRFFQRKTFGELVTLLASATSRRRDESVERPGENTRHHDVAHIPLVPWALRCQSSGVRPAVVDGPSGGETRALSEAAARKLFTGQRMKQTDDKREWFPDKFGYRPKVVEQLDAWQKLRSNEEKYTFVVNDAERNVEIPVWQAWEDQFRLHLNGENSDSVYAHAWQQAGFVRPAQDIGEISQASRPERYIGFIYGDGNNAGRKLASLRTPGEYIAFSEQMDADMRGATFTALAQHLEPSNVRDDKGRPRTVHPFEIITVGGDDVLLIVPGSAALKVALTLGYEFECRQGDQQQRAAFGRYPHMLTNGYDFCSYKPTLGLSAGVVIAPENTPIFFLRTLAEELLKSAKKRVRGDSTIGGAIDFMVLKSVTMVTDTITSFREQAFGREEPCMSRGTARPYLWPELQGLLTTVERLRAANVPRSQLYRMRERLMEARHEGGITASVVDFLHTCVSGLRPVARERLLAEMLLWNGPAQGRDIPPWLYHAVPVMQRDKTKINLDGYESILPDLVEIAEFVAEEHRDA